MNNYRVVHLKALAEKLNFKSANTFSKTELYLEYAIEQINQKSQYNFHQYLFLIDILYVIITPKSAELENPQRSAKIRSDIRIEDISIEDKKYNAMDLNIEQAENINEMKSSSLEKASFPWKK